MVRGELKQGAKFLRRLCEQPDSPPSRWLELAQLYLRAELPRDAIDAARRGQASGADTFTASCMIAEAAERAGKPVQAIAAYQDALRARPDAWTVHNNLALLYRRRGELSYAAEACRRALEYSPAAAGVHNNLGNIWRDMGRLEDALAAYTTAMTLDGEALDPRYNRALVLLQLNQSAAAHAAFQHVLACAPEHRDAALQSVEAVLSAGDFTRAALELDHLLDKQPTLAHAWFLKAQMSREPGLSIAMRDNGSFGSRP